MHIVKYRASAELGGSRECVLHGDAYALVGRALLEVTGQLKSIVKHRILAVG